MIYFTREQKFCIEYRLEKTQYNQCLREYSTVSLNKLNSLKELLDRAFQVSFQVEVSVFSFHIQCKFIVKAS